MYPIIGSWAFGASTVFGHLNDSWYLDPYGNTVNHHNCCVTIEGASRI